MNHQNFGDKPVSVVQKKAVSKKNAFFSDSDESDEQDKKPQAAAKPVVMNRAPPVTQAAPPKAEPVPIPEPVVQKQPSPKAQPAKAQPVQGLQAPDSTQHMWGDGEWHPDEQGNYFYYDD